MKKYYSILKRLFFVITVLFISCDREIVFDNNYDVKIVKPPSDVPFLVNKDNEITVELINVVGNDVVNYTYELDFEKINGDLAVKANSFQLIEGTFIPIEFKDNKLVMVVKPISLGVISFKLFLKDSSGKIKETIVQISSTDVPNTFDYTLKQNITEDLVVGRETTLLVNIKSTGNSSANFYNIKYNGTVGAVVKYNNVRLTENLYVPVSEGNLSFLYSNSNVGTNKIALTVKNAQGLTKELFLNIKTTAAPIEIVVQDNFEAKETIERNFDFILSNMNLSSSYNIRFSTSTNVGTIIKSNTGNTIPLNSFIPFQAINGKLTFSYLTNQPKNEVLTISVRDANNVIVSKTINVVVNPKPVITKIITNSYFVDAPPVSGQPTVRTFYSKFDFTNVLVGPNETISEYVINNISYTTKSQDRIVHVVPGTLYTAKIKDSSGRWSNEFTGRWGTN